MPNPRTPLAIRKLEGNPAKRPLQKEPKVTGRLRMPRTLTPAAKIIWKSVVGSMPEGVYLATDASLLAAFVEQVAAHDEAVAMIAQNGSVSKGSTGQEVVSPWVKIRNDSASKIVTLGSKLGLSPTDRANLPTGETDTENPFMN